MSNKKKMSYGFLTFIFLFNIFFYNGEILAIEEIEYQTENKGKYYEIRNYKPIIVAQVNINKEFKESSNRGFKILFDYIQGANISKTEIPMTTPVTQRANSIDVEAKGTYIQTKTTGGYLIQFKMPNEMKLNDLPKPEDDRIQLLEIPARKLAVYTYTGSWSESRYLDMLGKFITELEKDKILTVGDPIFARYNSPFKIWFLRRNEIWLQIKDK